MITFLSYDFKVAVLIAVFYVFYRIFLSKETFHRMNRVVLLSTALISFVLPLCIITTHRTEIIPVIASAVDAVADGTTLIAEQPDSSQPWWQTAIVIIYIIGVAIVLCKILISLVSILRLIHSAQDVREYQGGRLIISDTKSASFSWMNNIIIGRDDYEQGISEILDHEKAHIGFRHSWDILLVDLISAVQWFNPAIWMLRSDLRAIHEYEADEAVLLKGVDVKHYQYLLVSKAMADSGFSITNQFNHNNLKFRINMITKRKSNRFRAFKVLYILPIIGVSLAVSAKTIVDYQYEAITENDANGANSLQKNENLVPQDSIEPTANVNEPMIVLDGKIIDNDKVDGPIQLEDYLKRFGVAEDDIESVTVLKDAAALNIWGEKGRNGVIEVKTKSKQSLSNDKGNIDELVKKLPGAEMGEDGSVKVDGKPVQRILLNGQEIFPEDKEITSEDIVKKLPGAEMGEDGSVKLNGKTVSKVIVNGQEVLSNDTLLHQVDELVKKLPGVEKGEDGSVKLNGKTVNRVIVNGEEILSNDK